MSRLNGLLVLVLIVCALSVVTSQHRARRLFIDLQREQDTATQLAVEWNHLQIEQGSLAAGNRVETVATQALQMRVPDAPRTRVVVLGRAPPPAPAVAQ